MDDFQKLTDFENLYKSFLVSMKGKGKKKSAVKFNVLALENLITIKEQLLQHTYRISPYSEFIVSEPKKRIIKSGSFRDKVLQHCLCDYVLLPKMKDIFIRDNYAGQKGKGTLFGLNRLSENLLEFHNQYGYNGYILKCDITKFFYSINHYEMKKYIRKYFSDKDIQWLCDLFIDSVDGDGLPLGNQCSQVFALIYLSGLDLYITQELNCKFYGRYMDDFYLISDNKEYLQDCLEKIKTFLSSLHLTLNDKTEIVSIQKGIRFLGFHTYITEDGKIIRRLTGENKRAIKKRLKKYYKLVMSGKMSRKEFDEKYNSWRNHASHGNCIKLLCDMDDYVSTLFGEDKSENRIIVAGSRSFNDYTYFEKELTRYIKKFQGGVIKIITGGASGVDSLAERYAKEHNIPIRIFYANWERNGKSAGYIRNVDMLGYATKSDNCSLIAFWDKESNGTKNMITLARKKNVPTSIIYFNNKENKDD